MPIPVTTSELLEFKLKGFYDGVVEVNNIFHFQCNAGGTGTLNQFAAGLWHDLSAVLLPRTNDSVNYESVEGRIIDTSGNLVNSEMFIITAPNGLGADGGDSLPPTDTWTFKLLRPDGTFRHGYKRFAGVSEAAQTDGMPTSGVVASLDAIAVMLASQVSAYTIVGGVPTAPVAGATMVPVILQKQLNGDILDVVNIGYIEQAVFSRIGSQDTRAYGRGS